MPGSTRSSIKAARLRSHSILSIDPLEISTTVLTTPFCQSPGVSTWLKSAIRNISFSSVLLYTIREVIMKIIGHRGAAGIALENTAESIKAALALPIDGMEIDVRRTKDGHLVVIHDEDTSRIG